MRDDARSYLTGLLEWHRTAPLDLARLHLSAEAPSLYALVDVARDPELLERLAASGEAWCALDETREPDDLGETAPCLVALSAGAPTLATLLGDAWGTGAMVFFTTADDFPTAYRRALLRAGVEPARSPLRFWEPAPLCAALDADTSSLFAGVRAWLVESPRGEALLRYELVEGRVTRALIPLR